MSEAKYVDDSGVVHQEEPEVQTVRVASAVEEQTPGNDPTPTKKAPTSPSSQLPYDAARVVIDSEQQLRELAKKPKSLFIAIVVKNPFHEAREECDAGEPGARPLNVHGDRQVFVKTKPVPAPSESCFTGYAATKYAPATFMRDDDFLKVKGLLDEDSAAPNIFQKCIGMLVRLKRRHVTVLPGDVLEEGPPDPAAPWNYFHGFRLNESKMFLSPDMDEAYFKVHADRDVLLDFAERQALTLRTNPYSFAGGCGMIFTREAEEDLKSSVRDYMHHYEIPEEDSFCAGKKNKETGQHEGWGFCVEVPQKMRMLLRILREGWQFGGCGLQLSEMKENGDFVTNFFPLHNEAYMSEYDIDTWGSFTTLCNPCKALADYERPLIMYYGEQVAIYFSWMTKFCYHLIIPGLVGAGAGVVQLLGIRPNLIGGAYAIFLILWGVSWIRSWQQAEVNFALRWGQYVEAEAELVRDSFEFEFKRRIDVRSIFSLDFEFPLTMQRLPDGTMVELFFPANKRSFRRYAVSYPLLTIVAGAMVAGLFFTERLRFANVDDLKISIGASIVSALITTIFTKLSVILIELLNNFENCRTDTEYENEQIMKSFAFSFISTYFSVIAIAVWPNVPNDKRVAQLRAQMVTQIVAMPFVGNITELILPKIMTSIRKRRDRLGGYLAAICSYFCCCCVCDACTGCRFHEELHEGKEETEREKQAMQVWREAQLEPYESTVSDHLEISLQFGYCLMFAAAFPFAPLASFFNNLIEIRIDSHKLVSDHQRPAARISTGIGAWNDITWIFLALSIVTNSYYVVLITPTIDEVEKLPAEEYSKLLEYFTYLQYFMVVAVVILGIIRGATSTEAQKVKVKTQLLHDRIIQDYIKKQLSMPKDELKKAQEEADELLGAYKQAGCCGGGGDDDDKDKKK